MDPPKQQEVEKGKDTQVVEQKTEKKQKADKTYIKAKKKWKDFDIHESIIEALDRQNKRKPTKVQEETMEIALDPARKKFNLLVRAINGSGKTLAFLLPMICALQPGLKTAQDKTVRGKLMQKQIFKPQGIILIQNFLLQSQLNHYLKEFQEYGQQENVDKLNFTLGVLNQDGHTPGDIIICMPKSFLNRHQRGNMKLDQCKFVAIDEIDQIYHFDKDSLAKILKIIKNQRPNLIASSATMERNFLKFYEDCDPDYIRLNVNADLEKQTGKTITLEGVKNFYNSIPCDKQSKGQLHDFIIKNIFKQLYGRKQVNKKPQVFVFFNSADEIQQFKKKFDALAGDFTSDESSYLQNIKSASISAKTYKDGKKVEMQHTEKESIMTKFRNSETNVLMCTNIMARGIDIRNAVFVINVGAPKKSDKDDIIDVDIYLHRVGRTGRHNDKGVALTLGSPQQIEKLTDGVKKIHKIQIEKMVSSKDIVDEVFKCIQSNA